MSLSLGYLLYMIAAFQLWEHTKRPLLKLCVVWSLAITVGLVSGVYVLLSNPFINWYRMGAGVLNIAIGVYFALQIPIQRQALKEERS